MFTHPRYANSLGGILVDYVEEPERSAYLDVGGELHARALAGEWGAVTPLVPIKPSLSEAFQIKFAELDAKRRAYEEGGIMFGAVPLKTDRQTAAIITAAYVKAKDNADFTIPNWKFADGVFAPLDAETIIAAGDAITAHVQSAFDREAALSAQLLALNEVEDVLAFDVDARW